MEYVRVFAVGEKIRSKLISSLLYVIICHAFYTLHTIFSIVVSAEVACVQISYPVYEVRTYGSTDGP